MPGHAEFSGLFSGAKGFLVEETSFFPEGALGGKDADRKWPFRHKLREHLYEVGLNRALLVRPVVGSGTEFNLHMRKDIANGVFGKSGWATEQEALAVRHVGIDLQFPTGCAESGFETGCKGGLECPPKTRNRVVIIM